MGLRSSWCYLAKPFALLMSPSPPLIFPLRSDLGLSRCSVGDGGPALSCLAVPRWGQQIWDRLLMHTACPAALSAHHRQPLATGAECRRLARGCPTSVSPSCVRVMRARNPFPAWLPTEILPNGLWHQQSVLLPQLPLGSSWLSEWVLWPLPCGAASGASLTWCCWSFSLSRACARLCLRGLSSWRLSLSHPSAI